MNTSHPLPWLGLAALAALVACAGAPVGGDAVPASLHPGPGAQALTTLAASGVQIYECRAGVGAAAPAWAFVAPEADLFDARGRRVGRHGAGPFWAADDGSRIVGTLRSRADAPTVSAIPWLLLDTRSTGGAGQLSRVTSVQRIHTEGGLAPAGGCEARTVGQQARVPYRADYRLFVSA